LGGVLALAAPAQAELTAGRPGIYVNQPWETPPTHLSRGFGQVRGTAALPARGRLRVGEPGASPEVFLNGRTRYRGADGRPLPASALRPGAQVTVDYDYVGNTATARQVVIDAPPGR